MTRLEMRLENLRILERNLIHSLHNLKEAKIKHDDDSTSMYQDSVVMRFEPFYEITWKFLKDFLEQQDIPMIPSPKTIFSTCLQQGYISAQDVEMFNEIFNFRLKGAYGFDEEVTSAFAQKISQTYYPTMQEIINRLATQSKITK